MSSSSVIPAEADLLCESCGYTLSGLPLTGNCPECGDAIASSIGDHRHPPRWERERTFQAWVETSWLILLHPTRFFTTYTSRDSLDAARVFGSYHWFLAAILLGVAGTLHANWFFGLSGNATKFHWLQGLTFILIVLGLLVLTNQLAGRLTAWEAAYHGWRMPLPVVMRGLYYHSPHYLPVAVMGFATVAGYRSLLAARLVGAESAQVYLYVLCAEVIVGAVYLFYTYWIAMRSIRYANR